MLAVAPLVVLPGHVDFAVLPQQVFVQVGVLGCALMAAVESARRRVRLAPLRPLDLPISVFLAWSAVSVTFATDRGAGARILAHWAICGLAYVLVSRTARPADAPRLAGALLAGGAVAAAIGLAQALGGLTLLPQAGPPAATMANRALAAGYLTSVLPLALLVGRGVTSRRAALGAAAVIALFLPLTGSRAALVAVAVQALLAASLQGVSGGESHRTEPRLRRWRRAALVAAVIAVAATGVWRASLLDPEKARSTEIRWTLMTSALRMAADRPLLGVGLGNYGVFYPAYGPTLREGSGRRLAVDSPHNELLQVLTETGLPGLLAALWLAAATVRRCARMARSADPTVRRIALALSLSLTAFAVDAAFGFPLRSALPPMLVAVTVGTLSRVEEPLSSALRPAGTIRSAGWDWRWAAAAAGLAAALAGAAWWSFVRLASDRALYLLREAEARGAWAEAAVHGRAAVRADPRPLALLALARVQLRLGERAPAVELLERLVSVRPFDAAAAVALRWARHSRVPAVAGTTASPAMTMEAGGESGPGQTPDRLVPSKNSAGAPCTTGVRVERAPDGVIDLVADGAPLTEVLRCLVDRAGLLVEYEGPPPRQPVTLTLHGEPLQAAVGTLLEGLGVNYLLSADLSGAHAGRLIVFGASDRRKAPSPAASRPARSLPRDRPPVPDEELVPDTGEPSEPPPYFEPESEPLPADGTEPVPGAFPDLADPAQLTPAGL